MSSTSSTPAKSKKFVKQNLRETSTPPSSKGGGNDGSDYEDDSWEKPTQKVKTQKSTPTAKIHLGGSGGQLKSPTAASAAAMKQQQQQQQQRKISAGSTSWSDEDETEADFDDWKPGKSKPSPRNFGANAHVSSRRPTTGFGSSSDLAAGGRKGFFKNKRVRQCVLLVIVFALFSTYFSGSGARK